MVKEIRRQVASSGTIIPNNKGMGTCNEFKLWYFVKSGPKNFECQNAF